MEYIKPALSTEHHLEIMQKRGLQVPDFDKALHYLKYIGYYRFTGYCLPFQDNAKGGHAFVEGTSFDDVLELYIFDKELRIHILDALEGIEVAFRATVSDTMSLAYGPHWYLDKRHFGKMYGRKKSRIFDHEKLLREINDADSAPLRHYRRKYTNPIYPPSWMMIESLSFGSCSIMFAHLGKTRIRMVSKELGLEPTLLVSWTQGLVRLRNLCAHHSRIWNRKFSHTLSSHGEVPKELLGTIGQGNKLYEYASLIIYLLKRVDPETLWARKLSMLLAPHQESRLTNMGFPKDWEKRKVWRNFF